MRAALRAGCSTSAELALDDAVGGCVKPVRDAAG